MDVIPVAERSGRRSSTLMRGIAGLALVAVSSAAAAQTASQITPPTFAPKLERGGGFSVQDGGGQAAPAGAEKLFVRLAGVSVKDGLSELTAALQALPAHKSSYDQDPNIFLHRDFCVPQSRDRCRRALNEKTSPSDGGD